MSDIPRFSYLEDRQKAYTYFQENGCVVFRDLVSRTSVESLRCSVAEIIDQQVLKHLGHHRTLVEGNGFDRGLLELSKHNDLLRRRVYDVIQELVSLRSHAVDPILVQVARDLGTKIPLLRAAQFRMDFPADDRFLIPPHQEIRGIRSKNLIFFITALVDIPAEKGALNVALGSHKLGPLTPVATETAAYQFLPAELYESVYPLQPTPLKAGDTLVLQMYTIHGSAHNTTGETRWQTIVRFEDAANMGFIDGDDSYLNFDIKG